MADGWTKAWDSQFERLATELDVWPPTLVEMHVSRLLDPDNPNPRPSNRELAAMWGCGETSVRRRMAKAEAAHPAAQKRRSDRRSDRRTSNEVESGQSDSSGAPTGAPAGAEAAHSAALPYLEEKIGEEETGDESPQAPPWARARRMRKSDGEPMEIALAVKATAEVIVQRELDLPRMKSHAIAILNLWRHDGKRPLAAFLRDLRLVAEAAHECPEPIFARDLRAEGWTGGTPRQHSPASVCRHERWEDRLHAAQRWHDAGRPATQLPRSGQRPPAMPRQVPGGWIINGKHYTDQEAPDGIPF